MAPDFVGVNHDFIWSDEGQWDPLIDKIVAARIGWVRLAIRWRVVEPESGRLDFEHVDDIVSRLHARGIRILGILLSVPAWANGTQGKDVEGWFDAYPPTQLEDWSQFVRRTVHRYRETIFHWEIWNEENGVDFFRPMPDEHQYVALLREAYQSCKEVQPKSTVVLGGLQMNGVIANPWSPVKVENFLQRIYDAGGQPYFDAVNIHPYILSTDPIEKMIEMIEGTLEVMERNEDGQKPVWITEVGCGTNAGQTAETQARLLSESFRECRRIPQVQRVFWFCLQDLPGDVLGPESSMGLLTLELEEKPAYKTLCETIRESEEP